MSPLPRQTPNDSLRPYQPYRRRRRFLRLEKIGPAFWTITGLVSLTVNVVLIVILVTLGGQLFSLKQMVKDQLLGGLYQNFELMDQASIRTTIPVETSVPAKFDLPLETDTTVVLTDNVFIDNAYVSLDTGGLHIQGAVTDITLPAGTQLPVHLSLVVPVDQQIPVKLNVAVDIPLKETELHAPFVGLQGVVEPYYQLIDQTPNSWEEALCGDPPDENCQALIKMKQ